MVLSGPKQHATSYIEGLETLASMRLCPNVPTQYAVQTALGGYQSIKDLIAPGGRLLEQRDLAHKLLNDIPGVSCVKPKGALYAFPKLDPQVHRIVDDERFALDLLRGERLLIVQGTGFNWPRPDHFRVVTLARTEDLRIAMQRLGNFLSEYSQA
jgi:alanine-synthesizing transaminase